MGSTTIILQSGLASMTHGTRDMAAGTLMIHSFVERTILQFTRAGHTGVLSDMDTIHTTIRITAITPMRMVVEGTMGQRGPSVPQEAVVLCEGVEEEREVHSPAVHREARTFQRAIDQAVGRATPHQLYQRHAYQQEEKARRQQGVEGARVLVYDQAIHEAAAEVVHAVHQPEHIHHQDRAPILDAVEVADRIHRPHLHLRHHRAHLQAMVEGDHQAQDPDQAAVRAAGEGVNK